MGDSKFAWQAELPVTVRGAVCYAAVILSVPLRNCGVGDPPPELDSFGQKRKGQFGRPLEWVNSGDNIFFAIV